MLSWEWWYMSIIPALGRLRQEDHELEASLGYIVRPCLKKRKRKKSEQIIHNSQNM
jgi:hypothetical protein